MASRDLFPGASDRSTYTHFTPVTLRFGDTDGMGHINNAVYATLFESGRFFYFGRGFDQAKRTGRTFTLAKLSINFVVELFFPGTVEVGSRIINVGKSSIGIGHAVFKGDKCHAVSDSVIVLIDAEGRGSTPLTEDLLQIVEELRQSDAVGAVNR
jgi:acyl-CoA thioester hydrolase